jgi:electron transfer flavoprotein beta subunit
MNIIVCIKQVPASSDVKVDPKTGVLIRDGENVKMNPYDLYALEMSFELKSKIKDAVVHAITMGPPSAAKVLQEALYMGADEATLISDRRLAGADVYSTAYTLSQLIQYIQDYSIIICGKQTTDGDTAQVGPETAELLNIPHVCYVKEIIQTNTRSIVVKSGYDQYDEISEIEYPCLITVDKAHFVPRLPSFNRKRMKKEYEIKTITLKDLIDQDPLHYGLNGSPTQVIEIFPPTKNREAIQVHGSSLELSEKIFEILKNNKFL